jgi:hypothetical protein
MAQLPRPCERVDEGDLPRSDYPSLVDSEPGPQVAALKRLLDAEIKRQVSADHLGCWPLLVGVAGVVLGLLLLTGVL